jgi:hypothetical protein
MPSVVTGATPVGGQGTVASEALDCLGEAGSEEFGSGPRFGPLPRISDQPTTSRPCIHGWKAQRKYRIEPAGAVRVALMD